MALNNLGSILEKSNIKLVDTDAIVAQGRKAFMAMFPLRSNPFESDRDRRLWEIGWKAESQKWDAMQKRWKDQDRGTPDA